MNKTLKGYVIGVLTTTIVTGGVALAKSVTETIEVTYDNIKVYKDNVLCETKDSNGNTVEPFIYNGTTYMPVRGTAQLADMRVTWDGASKSVYLWDEMSEDGNLYALDVCPPYETESYTAYMTNDGKSFSMANKKYANGFVFYCGAKAHAYFNLNGKYSSMEFELGHVDDSQMGDKTIRFYVDDKLVYEYEALASALPKNISIPLNYGLQLRIESDNPYGSPKYGFGNPIFKN